MITISVIAMASAAITTVEIVITNVEVVVIISITHATGFFSFTVPNDVVPFVTYSSA